MTNHARTIIDALGREAIRSKVDVTEHSIKAARFKGTFPASWYLQIDRMCAEAGIECPPEAFNFKSSAPLSEAAE